MKNVAMILIRLIYFRLLVNFVFVQFPQSIFRRNVLCANGSVNGALAFLDDTSATSKVKDGVLLYLSSLYGYFWIFYVVLE